MRYLFIIAIFLTSLFSKNITINDLIKYYKDENYKKVCTKGILIFEKIKKDEKLVTMYALSCLKSDYIDRLAVPIVILKNSKEARANAAYFSTILAQKKLLYHALIDNIDISGLIFPKTDHIISKIFTLFVEKKYIFSDNTYIFNETDEKDIIYKLFLEKDKKPIKMVILKIKKGKIVETHKFW
ncbi:hypothetical protein [Nitrosophilus kaiyonis]|uniref:hypothetical protein n=1 Tax=Nitrosophilus kaiyonis TaxID=2930200 RepID=UPI002491D853|nr:hypothetical protein [Nitrosophilus kaiyonis]